MVDYPRAHYWCEIAAHYLDAKVLHSVRDPDKWFESTQGTIFAPGGLTSRPGPVVEFFASFTGKFRGRMHDRAFMTDYFHRHTEYVVRTIAPERLLIYEVDQGWAPLCAFLGAPVPDEPFPSEYSRAKFIARVSAARGDPAHFSAVLKN